MAPEIIVAPLYHWYVGAVPPLVGEAVKIIVCPLQMLLPTLDAIVSDGVPLDVIVIVMADEVAVAGDAQPELEVSWQVIASLFAKPEAE